MFTSHMHNDTELFKASAQLSAAALSYSTLKKLQEVHCQLATGTQLRTRVVCSQHQPHPIITYCTFLWNGKTYRVSRGISSLHRGGNGKLSLDWNL